jgi:hypothetical protein
MTTKAQETPHVGDDPLRVAEAVHAGEVSVAFKPGPARSEIPASRPRLRAIAACVLAF